MLGMVATSKSSVAYIVYELSAGWCIERWFRYDSYVSHFDPVVLAFNPFFVLE